MHLTLQQYLSWVESGLLNPKDVISHYLHKIKETNSDLFSFVRIHDTYVDNHRDTLSHLLLKGAPIGIKDNIMIKGEISSCGSKMLEQYIAPYSATCFLKLEQAGALALWKTNMDEFAMGSSTETSYFGRTKNPYGNNRIPGWSSWGSAAAVAGDLCLAALWTDTGWSIRQPAALCGIVWLKPTYGRVSRYGVQSMASSFDQVGTLTKTVADARILLDVISGYDESDAQSDKRADEKDFLKPSLMHPSEVRIAVPNEAFSEALDSRVEKLFREKIVELQSLGYQVEFVDFPILQQASPIYYMLISAEVTSNLSRFDGVRFWLQKPMSDFWSLQEYYTAIRSEGFGDEVKKRLLLWNYVVQHENYSTYYQRWYQARKFMKQEFEKFFETYHIILTPTTPTPAGKLDEKTNNSLLMYLEDMYTVPANLAGLPAISLPMGMVEEWDEQLPVGIQLMGAWWKEWLLLDIAELIEKKSI